MLLCMYYPSNYRYSLPTESPIHNTISSVIPPVFIPKNQGSGPRGFFHNTKKTAVQGGSHYPAVFYSHASMFSDMCSVSDSCPSRASRQPLIPKIRQLPILPLPLRSGILRMVLHLKLRAELMMQHRKEIGISQSGTAFIAHSLYIQ